MAGRYLPTELQNENGDVIYPHTDAGVVWTQDGKSVEEKLKEKTKIVITGENIPIAQREKGAIYLFKDGAGTQIEEGKVAMASPAVGYKVIN